jgi:hypothetical protein
VIVDDLFELSSDCREVMIAAGDDGIVVCTISVPRTNPPGRKRHLRGVAAADREDLDRETGHPDEGLEVE